MPVILNIATNLLFGAAVPLMVRRSRALRQDFLCWQLLFLTAFEALIFTPSATYLFRFYPQWSMFYLFDPQLYPDLEAWLGLLSFLAIALNFGAAVLGFALAREGILRKKLWMWAAPLGAGGLIWLVTLLTVGSRIAFIGDFDSFWQGNAEVLFKHFPGWVALTQYGATIAFVLWIRRRFASHDPTLL